MNLKLIIIPGVLLVLILGGIFAYKLSQDTNDVHKDAQKVQNDISAKQQKTNQTGSNQTGKSNGDNGREELEKEQKQDLEGEDQADAQNKEMAELKAEPSEKIRPFFVKDLASYVVAKYYPAGSVDNTGSEGVSAINFKSLNARYGIEFIGMRHQGNTLKAARNEILNFLMQPKVLNALYSLYADQFVQEIVNQARDTQKEFVVDEDEIEQRSLSNRHIEEILRLNSNYLQNVAQIFQIAGKDTHISKLVDSYLKADQEVTDANFELNKVKNRYQILLEKAKQKDNEIEEQEVLEVKEIKEQASLEYRDAIRKRERFRKKIIQRVHDNTQNLSLAEHEILSVAQWAFRRMDTNKEQRDFLLQLSELLKKLSAEFKARARQL